MQQRKELATHCCRSVPYDRFFAIFLITIVLHQSCLNTPRACTAEAACEAGKRVLGAPLQKNLWAHIKPNRSGSTMLSCDTPLAGMAPPLFPTTSGSQTWHCAFLAAKTAATTETVGRHKGGGSTKVGGLLCGTTGVQCHVKWGQGTTVRGDCVFRCSPLQHSAPCDAHSAGAGSLHPVIIRQGFPSEVQKKAPWRPSRAGVGKVGQGLVYQKKNKKFSLTKFDCGPKNQGVFKDTGTYAILATVLLGFGLTGRHQVGQTWLVLTNITKCG